MLAASEADREQLEKLLAYRMPFGKYKNTLLLNLPEPYVVWFHKKGLPDGELGKMLGLLYEIKLNGLEKMLRPLIHEEMK